MIKNETCKISIGSLTYAIKAQKALTVAALYSEVIKLEGGRGCTYGLEFPCNTADGVSFVLKNEKVRFKEVNT